MKSRPKPRVRAPFAVLTRYGPDDKTVTKIAVGISPTLEGGITELKRWLGEGVTSNVEVRAEIKAFLKEQGARTLVITPGVFGCPHEEGTDFPEGDDCPLCPFWKGKQGSGAAVEQRWATLGPRRIVDLRTPGTAWWWSLAQF